MNERLRFYEELSPRHDIASNNDNKNERPIMKLPGKVSSYILNTREGEKKNANLILILILISDTIFRQLADYKRARQPPEEFSVPAVTRLRGIVHSWPGSLALTRQGFSLSGC